MSIPTSSTPPPRRIFLLTHPRSASNLLIRMLNLPAQPNVASKDHGGYYFFPAYCYAFDKRRLYSKQLSEWTSSERTEMMQKLQECSDALETDVSKADAEGKTSFVKDHTCFMAEPMAWTSLCRESELQVRPTDPTAQPEITSSGETPWTVSVPDYFGTNLAHAVNNTTPLPDAYLKAWHPTFLVRHPALAFPSYWRIVRGTADAAKLTPQMSLRYTRQLYEFYCGAFGKSLEIPANAGEARLHAAAWPILLTADDVILSPAVLERWCGISGLDASKLKYEWQPASEEEKGKMHEVARIMTVSLQESGGIMKEKAGEVDLEGEVEKWKEEFGVDEARRLEEWVRAAVGDWEWLRGRRLAV